jgi:hypothetical protein
VGIAYSNSPHSDSKNASAGQALLDLNALANTQLVKSYGHLKHTLTPYTRYHFLSTPRVPVDDYYVFTIRDGYSYLNLVRFGAKNAFFLYPLPPPDYHLSIDIWANAFLGATEVPQVIPKGYVEVELQPNPFMILGLEGGWNFAHSQVDYANFYSDITLTEDIAFGLEMRHRSRYDWRKADFYNFILDAARPEEELLLSPLSDRRNTFLARLFYRFHPNWDAKIQSRTGWDRILEPHYREYQVDLGKILFNHYRVGFTYERRQADNRFSFSFKLNPSPPTHR